MTQELRFSGVPSVGEGLVPSRNAAGDKPPYETVAG